MPAPIQNFAGLSFADNITGGRAGAGWPPDTTGDVGRNHYIEAVNEAFAIYDKTGVQLAAFTENSLWSGAGTTPCTGNSYGDPIVIYDRFADRWILANLGFANFSPPFYECIAVSQTSDPVAGGWWLYPLRMDPGGVGLPPVGTLNDYPKFGIWNDGCLYMSANGFGSGGSGSFVGALFASLNLSDMEAGLPVTWSLGMIANSSDPFSMLPSNLLGGSAAALPPAGTPNYYVSQSSSTFAFEVRTFTPGANCGAGGILSAPVNVSESSYTIPAGIPQPGTSNILDSLDDRLLQKLQYRKVGSVESLWVVHSVRTSNSTPVAEQWAQLDVTGGTIATSPVQQQIYTPDATLNRWMGSIAADRRGNVALGYSTSNGTAPNYPSIAYSGRLATDPVNNLSQTETVLLSGSGSQTSIFRWGDYSSMSVDPTDDCTFWYTNEYYSSQSNGTSGNWQTRIGSFKFPSCAPTTPELNVSKTHTGIFSRGQNGATFTVTVSNTPNAPTTSGTVTVTDTLPSGLSLVSMVGTGWTCNSNVCTRSDGLTGGASYPAITVTVNVASDASSPQVNSVTVSGGGSPSATATDTVLPAPRLFVTKSHSGNFIQGQNGVYTVTVSNVQSGSTTTGTITVTDTLPPGLTLVSILGAGWACNSNSCTRSDALDGGSAYPPITVTVSVSTTATSPQVNSVSATGGGSPTATATDSTVIIPLPPPNDEATSATVVGSLPYSTSEDTTSATTNPADPSPCTGIGRTVWFRYVADFTGTLRVDTAGSNFDTVLVAYQGTVSSASFIGCNDDADGTLQSRLMLQVTSGQTYYLEAGSFGGGTGGMLNLHVLRPSVLSITKAHSGTFSQGQTNATYKVVVSNDPSAAATSGTVTVTDTPQSGLTLVSMAGTGWTCITSTCTRSDALAPGSSYPAITVTVNVSNNAFYVYNSANVSGGGSTPAYAYDNGYVLTTGWSISKSHSGSFVQGQTGTTYTVLVSNFTSNPAGGSTVTVTDSLPSGLTLVSMAGTGWTCTSNTCTRSDGLLPSSSYPPITVTVNVAANATSPQVNSVSVSGGGLSNNSATDSTVILASGLTIAKTHSGDFAQGQNGATYTVTVSNPAGAPASSGFVFVQEIMPSGLTFVGMAGTGWSCAFKNCSRSDALAGGSSYPPITVTVNVSPSATSPQVNAVTLSESGAANSTAFDSTNITSVAASNDEIATAAVISSLPASLAENTTLTTSNPNDPPQSCSLTPSKPAPKSLQNGHTVWFKYVADFSGPLRVDTAGSDYDTVLTAYLTSVSSNTEVACNDDVDGTLQSRIIFPVTSGQTYYFEAASFGTTSGGGLILHVLKPIVLSISKTHTGSFTQGQTGATYTLTVSNAAGAAATDGSMVSVSDTLPSGLTLVSMTGTGWNCSYLYCYRFDSLAGGTSYPPITVTVNVLSNATSPQVNSARLTGGGSLSASAIDSTVVLVPVLGIGKTHVGDFTTGQTGAIYTVTVSNTGAAPTNGTPVTVAEMPPSFLTLVSMAGTGWTCTVNGSFGNCTRTDALAAGSSYPSIAVVVNVAANATSPQVNSVSVSGGGSATASVTDSTTITTVIGSNLAQGKTATQSSTGPWNGTAGASSAVDGNTDGNYSHGSVTATFADANAWWQVDLGNSAAISAISIWNRTDCCSDRLSDYWVFVSNTPFGPSDTPATLQNRAGTWSSHQTVYPNPVITITPNVQGRYVRVQLSGTNYLSLAEVQVFGTYLQPNLAQGKTATQSSTGPWNGTAGASSAVDGNTDGQYWDGSVTTTNLDANAWWQVDLGNSAAISSISIWNRTDCCPERLSDYWVFVSNTPFAPSDTPTTLQNRAGTWSSHQTAYPNSSTTITLNAQGRYVRVQLGGTNYLSLAEVQVFGAFLPNLAPGKSATQSSTGPWNGTAGAASAVDGNTDGQYWDGSVTATNLDANAWWQVDLGASAAIGSVSIWNRTDCCSDRLNDYWVFVSNTPFLSSDTPATLQNRAGTWSSHQTTFPNPSSTITVNAQGRYVRVQLSETNYLSLAEVQVFGTF